MLVRRFPVRSGGFSRQFFELIGKIIRRFVAQFSRDFLDRFGGIFQQFFGFVYAQRNEIFGNRYAFFLFEKFRNLLY